MSLIQRRPLPMLGVLVLLVALVALVAPLMTTSDQRAHAAAPSLAPAAKSTIVLVHGAWADSSGWNKELAALNDRGYDAIAVANPLRGLTADAAYVRSVLDTIEGPIVLVAHSYGGAVISSAAAGDPDVKALVYIAGFVPDEGEPVGLLTQLNPGSLVTEQALTPRPYPLPEGGSGVDLYLRREIFRKAFAADLPAETTRLMWATQRPLSTAAFSEPAGPAAWHTIPSWYLIATDDKTIPPATQAYMAERAGATVAKVQSSHVAMMSHPEATMKLIMRAIQAVQ